MSLIRRTWARFLSLFKKADLDREFEEEARSHIALAVEDYVQRGMPLAEAQRLARVKFGAIEASKAAHRDSRGLPWLEGFLYDLRFALRGLLRDRAFALTVIAMLALTISLNTAVFAVMDAMLFRGYPLVHQNDRLLYLQERFPSTSCCISYPDFEAWRSQSHAFETMAFVSEKTISLRDGDGHPLDTGAVMVSANTLGLLGVSPMMGRDFSPGDEIVGAPPVVILNYRFWQSRFGKRADIVGATVHINGAAATIIGVMPEHFDFPSQNNLWMPVSQTSDLQRRGVSQGYIAVARLRNGVSRQEATAELETINYRLAAAFPATDSGIVPVVHPYFEMVSGPDAPMIWGSLWAGALLVLLVACANLANLSMARTLGRWREFATRMALGAGRARMVQQMFLESLMLAGAAGTISWWITNWSVRAWATATASAHQVLDYTVDSQSVAYLAALSAATGILYSLFPIGRIWQLGANGSLAGEGRGVTLGQRGKRLVAGLIVLQMALAIVLLSGAGVLVRSFENIVGAKTGVHDPEHVLVGLLRLPSDKYSDRTSRLTYFDRLQAQLKTVSEIEEQSIASSAPVGSGALTSFEVEGSPSPPNGGDSAQFLTVGSNYFRVLGAPVISGREFSDRDLPDGPPVAIVNRSFVEKFWPGEEPIGKRLQVADSQTAAEWPVVVGVVANIMQGDSLRQRFKPLVYLPIRQAPPSHLYFFGRTGVDPNQVAQAVRAEVQRVDPDVELDEFTTLKARFAFQRDSMDPVHSELGKYSAVAPVFALTALLLAAIGLTAVIAYSVSQRTKEIGVRMALGALTKDVRVMIFREGMRPVAAGTIIGLALSLFVNRILQSQLVGLGPNDPVTMTAAPLILIVVALLACQIPAHRATRVDPTVTLRHD